MGSCEIVIDITNYKKIDAPPSQQDRDNYGEVWFQEKLRKHELDKQANATSKQFFLAVRWFLEKQLNFKDIKATVAGDETVEREGLEIVDTKATFTEAEKARFFSVAGLLLADSQIDPLNGKTKEMLSSAAGDETEKTS